jgi:hypothetical protein
MIGVSVTDLLSCGCAATGVCLIRFPFCRREYLQRSSEIFPCGLNRQTSWKTEREDLCEQFDLQEKNASNSG